MFMYIIGNWVFLIFEGVQQNPWSYWINKLTENPFNLLPQEWCLNVNTLTTKTINDLKPLIGWHIWFDLEFPIAVSLEWFMNSSLPYYVYICFELLYWSIYVLFFVISFVAPGKLINFLSILQSAKMEFPLHSNYHKLQSYLSDDVPC